MTLEEMIREWALRAASVNCESAYRAGANRMLSELLPVMKEMNNALEMAEVVITDDYPSALRIVREALEKYNALFEDKQKQS